jgi:acyl-CoA thioesterase 8
MLCSFQRPEPWQPVHQWTMPQVPSPEQCEDEETVYARAIQKSTSNLKVMRILQERLTVSNLLFHGGSLIMLTLLSY